LDPASLVLAADGTYRSPIRPKSGNRKFTPRRQVPPNQFPAPEENSRHLTANPEQAMFPEEVADAGVLAEDTGAEGAPAEPGAEPPHLWQMLEEQRRATLQAIHSSAELEKQLNQVRTELSVAQTELDKKKSLYASRPKDGRQSFSNQAAEIATLRAGLYQAEKQFAREHQIRETESKQASRKVSELAVELAAVHAHSEPRPSFWRRGAWRTALIAVATCAVGVIGAAAYNHHDSASPVASLATGASSVNESSANGPGVTKSGAAERFIADIKRPAATPDPAALHRVQGEIDGKNTPQASWNHADFSGALDRLDTALLGFPGVKPESVLRAVYRNSKQCALLWNEGHPALLYGTGPMGQDGLASAVSRCAEAVERLR